LLRQRQLAASPERRSQIESAVSQALQAGGFAPSARQQGMSLAKTAQDLSPSIWWDEFAAAFGTQRP
jgi:hypothetical protein